MTCSATFLKYPSAVLAETRATFSLRSKNAGCLKREAAHGKFQEEISI